MLIAIPTCHDLLLGASKPTNERPALGGETGRPASKIDALPGGGPAGKDHRKANGGFARSNDLLLVRDGLVPELFKREADFELTPV